MEERKRTIKLRLLPTKKQETLLWQHVNHSRILRNKLVEIGNKAIENKESITRFYFYPYINDICNMEEYKFLLKSSKASLKKIGEELSISYRRYFNHTSEKPKFHKKGKCSNYFFPRSDSKNKFYFYDNNKLQIEKIGRVKVSSNSFNNHKELIKNIIEKDYRKR